MIAITTGIFCDLSLSFTESPVPHQARFSARKYYVHGGLDLFLGAGDIPDSDLVDQSTPILLLGQVSTSNQNSRLGRVYGPWPWARGVENTVNVYKLVTAIVNRRYVDPAIGGTAIAQRVILPPDFG